jgi:histidinol-phosphatase
LYQKELELAIAAARRAGEIALQYWNQGVQPDRKADDSPVTIADRESEKAIGGIIQTVFPDDGLLGEEGSAVPSSSGRRWIIDPVDGTRDFVRGNRMWAVLIALEDRGDVVVGVAYFPALNDLYWATKGSGAFCNGQPIAASSISTIAEAVVCVNGFNHLTPFPFASTLLEWLEPFWGVRSFGGALDAMMIARGQADLWIEPVGKEWDFAPLKVIIEEAGGRFFNFDGGSSIYGGSCIACAPGMEAAARAFLRTA